ncbi:hypothetical protein PHLGIDRAFT_102877 [Phlebiopsis gigantea 11061_1 CR5-6]|uniref:Uncharacterized protein n=1 Tax=Phlebiopsis gigantea (strain 11061_1 CR5-6) TaxID=745531 RepID=A0A0C3SD79_PHLG1|nr:hypothetical protein PHLGIDRAFT_102877 [Phlebiopsis gigantea 11061_1 CR5-6]
MESHTLEPIPVEIACRDAAPLRRFFTCNSEVVAPALATPETDLLRAVRSALRGTNADTSSAVTSLLYPAQETIAEEEELSWDTYNVVLGYGGVVRKKWNLENDKQPIQWACAGWFEQPAASSSPSVRSGAYTSEDQDYQESSLEDPNQRPTFGPFTRTAAEARTENEPAIRQRAVFVFLRSIGRVFFMNGLEHTFYLPFLVRRAWSLYPHGIMMQRVLEPGELDEAVASGDEPLPTLFTMVNPFAEASTVGLTATINATMPSSYEELKNDPEIQIDNVPANEHVLWTSCPTPDPVECIVVTLNSAAKRLTIWRYCYLHPKSLPKPKPQRTTRTTARPRHSLSSPLSPRHTSFAAAIEQPPLASLPGAPPALTAATMASIVPGSATVGGRVDTTPFVDPVDYARMKPTFWMAKLYSETISDEDVADCENVTVGVFDRRYDGKAEHVKIGVCLPHRRQLIVVPVGQIDTNGPFIAKDKDVFRLPAVSIAPIRIVRFRIYDLLIIKPNGSFSLLTHGTREMPLRLQGEVPQTVVSLENPVDSSVTLRRPGDSHLRTTLRLSPKGVLTSQCLQTMAMVLPVDEIFTLHHRFLLEWSATSFSQSDDTSFKAFCSAIYSYLGLAPEAKPPAVADDPWSALCRTASASRFLDDPALRKLKVPRPFVSSSPAVPTEEKPHAYHSIVLNGLHHVAQEFIINVKAQETLLKLVPVICRLALTVRPEWADYWKRLIPDAIGPWPSPAKSVMVHLDDNLPVWPPDVFALLYGKIGNPDLKVAERDSWEDLLPKDKRPSFVFGLLDPCAQQNRLLQLYCNIGEPRADTRRRAEYGLRVMVRENYESTLDRLPLGPAAPLREVLRTCQLSPASDWPIPAYQLVGRNDLAEGLSKSPEPLHMSGYRSVKDYILPTFPRRSIGEHADEVRRAISGEVGSVTGVELELEDFTSIRFGQDRRLEEVARLLRSSSVSAIKIIERPELNELDQAKEHQLQLLRVAERTLALPPGRALFTFGTVQVVTKEAYAIPKIEYAIRLFPHNIVIAPEQGKIPLECAAWGDFHNGVAAGLRIAPNATGIQSSWIKFNKPSELTPEHAGFLYALGLTGHLREMLTWHTFAYLTPKHDLTSIAVLLGLAAANAGTRNRHVTKLIAVHTPALLPTPDVDLNVPLITQAAGLSGIGLLYMGTKNRRMAEVCLSQISRKDLVQPDLSNEYREAYTFSAALAFGMVMLGKGSNVPADLSLLSRLRVLIHGESHMTASMKNQRPSFDVNLTSPAATIALGLMYLRTERKDVAGILTIPDTILTLDRIQPSFLLLRTLAKSLILFDSIQPTVEWVSSNLPPAIAHAAELKGKGQPIHESFELAYYNIVAGACFALALKYAGTAREEAYILLIRFHDNFSQMAYSNTPAIEHRIKRAAIRDGLNIIAISLNIVMAGTGEINCFRRLRFSFAPHNLNYKYGTHVMVHMSLGLLFLGGGKYTLGTSDAAIACLVTAFFPRFNQVSSDNKTYLQALRHMWVLAVEPRCLITRDVDTKEVVYLPVKIKVKDGGEAGTTQLIAPTLIPDVDKIQSIRVDTPRYWPFYLDIGHIPHHKEALLRDQTLYVKRRTAFLSYTEDPKGSRSLFVRSGSSAGDAAVLDFPQLKTADQHPATDLHQFISSYSNDTFFLAFADRFCRDEGQTEKERLFLAYCHAALLDSILQDKSRTIQTHLTMYRYRTMTMDSPYFGLAQQDLRFAAEFYSKVYAKSFSGKAENNPRPALLRESSLRAALLELDEKIEGLRRSPPFRSVLRDYVRGAGVPEYEHGTVLHKVSRGLAIYLQRHSVPVSTLLVVLNALAMSSRTRCLRAPPPHGTTNEPVLGEAIRQVLHATGMQMTTFVGSGWSLSSLEEILETWDKGGEDSREGVA